MNQSYGACHARFAKYEVRCGAVRFWGRAGQAVWFCGGSVVLALFLLLLLSLLLLVVVVVGQGGAGRGRAGQGAQPWYCTTQRDTTCTTWYHKCIRAGYVREAPESTSRPGSDNIDNDK